MKGVAFPDSTRQNVESYCGSSYCLRELDLKLWPSTISSCLCNHQRVPLHLKMMLRFLIQMGNTSNIDLYWQCTCCLLAKAPCACFCLGCIKLLQHVFWVSTALYWICLFAKKCFDKREYFGGKRWFLVHLSLKPVNTFQALCMFLCVPKRILSYITGTLKFKCTTICLVCLLQKVFFTL